MLSAYKGRLVLVAAACTVAACATSSKPHSQANGEVQYFDSAYYDQNRAPASVTPPPDSGSQKNPMDPVYMRTQADYHFAMGEAFSFEGNSSKAIESFKMVLVYDAKSSHVSLRLAAEYVKMGMLNEALENAQAAVEKDAKSIEARLLLGGLFSTLKSYPKAVQQYDEVLAINPQNTDAPMYLGAVYAEQKQYDKALKYFESLAKNEDYATPHLAHYYMGRVRIEQDGEKNLKAAELHYRKALELKPDHVESVLAISNIYEKQGKEDKALQLLREFQRDRGPSTRIAEILAQKYLEQEKYELAYEQLEVLEANSEDTLNVKVKMALVLIEQKKFDQAILRLHDVLRHVPDSDKIRFYLAAVYEEVGKLEEAVKHYKMVPTASQFYGEAVLHAAYILKQQKKVSDAIALVESGVTTRGDIPQLYALYASLLDDKGELKKALTVLEDGVKKFPDHVQIRFFLGTVFDRLGDKQKTIENMKLVVNMDPNHVQGLNYLAFTYAESNQNLDEAEKLARRALDFEPADGYILDTLGWILYKRGEVKESIKVLESAYQHNPGEAVIAEHLGDAYFKHELTDKAKRMYEKAVENEVDLEKAKNIRAKITAIERQDVARPRIPASVQGK